MRFKDWSDRGVWDMLFKIVADDPDMDAVMIDATIVRAHACSAGYKKDSQNENALGRSKGGFTTEIHALVDGLGNPLKFILTPGQKHDVTQADALIKDIKNTMVLADKGYDSNALIESIEESDSISVIPPKKSRKILREYDEHVYKERHLIKCFLER